MARRQHPDRPLSQAELDAFAVELDAIRAETAASLGQRDADYIRRVAAWVQVSGLLGRALLLLGAILGAFLPVVFWPALIAGTLLFALSKILENMELAHNVMHGQYDWMGDPHFAGRTYEWDIAGTSDNWRHTHNLQHHTWTNVRGMDDDIGYGLLRIFPEQRWRPFYLAQPLIAPVFALLFEWGIAIQHLKLGRWIKGRMSSAELRREFRPVRRKMLRQVVRDYVILPLLAGPFFLPVLLGAIVANLIRNVWTWVIIFCGHFTTEAQTFSKESVVGESRGHWYLRQVRGSSNLEGGRWMNVMSGNLSHQIEHHLFPDLPANRYAEIAPRVREICARYGQHYNTGSLPRQFGQVVWRLLRHTFPSRPSKSRPARELAPA
ncbi:fatty acid desaturase family protein [Pseudomarimonas salicorniae]|uniref:Acyl-CoA desaturase n=1 Tax=Pseudomarimonas salicorniae TaxID=2933270 RepID=A0ABT0GM02_9GAMM|nr:acyl-CoA desaturase [Lysobacter sp. CAU 1642]MCK7595546.1 acyl-CoA desaturase [Lysobacter sp. CAU 1642]